VLPRQIRIARDLLQHRIKLGGSGGYPLQILVIEHKGRRLSGLIAIVQTRPENAAQHSKNGDRK
jgi:hypothetical protein